MQRIIDLTFPSCGDPSHRIDVIRSTIALHSPGTAYTGVVYELQASSMAGTYLDLPGHILETDDGVDIATYPLDRLYRRRAVVIRLHRTSESGPVTGAELQAACPVKIFPGDALIINALGTLRWDEIAGRSVYLSADAVEWIIASGIDLLFSDIYESRRLDGVFLALFRAGIATLCAPANLHELTAPEVKLTLLPLPVRGVTQIPCRVVAELEEKNPSATGNQS